jgi:hypothetical protein
MVPFVGVRSVGLGTRDAFLDSSTQDRVFYTVWDTPTTAMLSSPPPRNCNHQADEGSNSNSNSSRDGMGFSESMLLCVTGITGLPVTLRPPQVLSATKLQVRNAATDQVSVDTYRSYAYT